MKKVLFLAMGLAVAVTASAQGIFNGNTGASQIGTAGKCFEYAGTPNVTGTVALSSTSEGQWFVGAVGTAEADLKAAGTPKAFSSSGYCLPGSITTTFAGGSTIEVQFRAWKISGGDTWETGSVTPSGFSKASSIIQVTGLTTGIATPPQVVGFVGVTLQPNTPEPSTIALGVLGLSVLLFRRRK